MTTIKDTFGVTRLVGAVPGPRPILRRTKPFAPMPPPEGLPLVPVEMVGLHLFGGNPVEIVDYNDMRFTPTMNGADVAYGSPLDPKRLLPNTNIGGVPMARPPVPPGPLRRALFGQPTKIPVTFVGDPRAI